VRVSGWLVQRTGAGPERGQRGNTAAGRGCEPKHIFIFTFAG